MVPHCLTDSLVYVWKQHRRRLYPGRATETMEAGGVSAKQHRVQGRESDRSSNTVDRELKITWEDTASSRQVSICRAQCMSCESI